MVLLILLLAVSVAVGHLLTSTNDFHKVPGVTILALSPGVVVFLKFKYKLPIFTRCFYHEEIIIFVERACLFLVIDTTFGVVQGDLIARELDSCILLPVSIINDILLFFYQQRNLLRRKVFLFKKVCYLLS
jgi:hypothetical protein